VTVEWHNADRLPPLKNVPTVYSPTPELEKLADSLNSASEVSGVTRRTNCDFCMRSFPTSGSVPALRDLTIAFIFGQTKTITGGPWYLCVNCKGGLGLKEGAGTVTLSKVRNYYKGQVFPLLRKKLVGQYGEQAVSRSGITVQLYGPG